MTDGEVLSARADGRSWSSQQYQNAIEPSAVVVHVSIYGRLRTLGD